VKFEVHVAVNARIQSSGMWSHVHGDCEINMHCVTFLCCPLFLSGTVMKMEHHLILHILFKCGLSTIVVVGGLAIEDKQNGFLKARD